MWVKQLREHDYLYQESANFSCKGLDSDYFWSKAVQCLLELLNSAVVVQKQP